MPQQTKTKRQIRAGKYDIEKANKNLEGSGAAPFEQGDIDNLGGELPEIPHFPFLMLLAAGLKDILDIIQLTGVGMIIVWIATVIIGVVIWIWILLKTGITARALKRRIWWYFGGTLALEATLSIIPATMLLVLGVYWKELKDALSYRSALAGALNKLGKK